jgi:hypothetical protein
MKLTCQISSFLEWLTEITHGTHTIVEKAFAEEFEKPGGRLKY